MPFKEQRLFLKGSKGDQAAVITVVDSFYLLGDVPIFELKNTFSSEVMGYWLITFCKNIPPQYQL